MSIYANKTHDQKKAILKERLADVCQRWRDEQELREGRNDFVNFKEGEQ